MEENKKNSRNFATRRDFLLLAAAGAVCFVTDWPQTEGLAEVRPPMQAGTATDAGVLDTGGIAMEHFAVARKRADGMVSKLALKGKISQFGVQAPAIEPFGMPAFNYYASEALHGLIHDGPVTPPFLCRWRSAAPGTVLS